jgi:hypothetical protein
LHLGAAGCPGTNPTAPPSGDCSAPNLARSEISDFSLDGVVVGDVGRLFETTDLTFNTSGTAPGCMSELGDPECAKLLPRLGIDDSEAQRFFAAD